MFCTSCEQLPVDWALATAAGATAERTVQSRAAIAFMAEPAKHVSSSKTRRAYCKASPVNCAAVRFSRTLTGVVPSPRSTVPLHGSGVTVALSWDAEKLASFGVGILIAVASLFSATVSGVVSSVNTAIADVAGGVLLEAASAAVTDGVLLEAIARVAVPETVLPLRSDMINGNSELWPAPLGVGVNSNPLS